MFARRRARRQNAGQSASIVRRPARTTSVHKSFAPNECRIVEAERSKFGRRLAGASVTAGAAGPSKPQMSSDPGMVIARRYFTNDLTGFQVTARTLGPAIIKAKGGNAQSPFPSARIEMGNPNGSWLNGVASIYWIGRPRLKSFLIFHRRHPFYIFTRADSWTPIPNHRVGPPKD